jgi:hypothetical protein
MGREQIQRFLRARACFAAEAQGTTSASSIMPPTAPGGRKGGMCLVSRVVERHRRDFRLTSTITVCTDVSTDRVFHVWNRPPPGFRSSYTPARNPSIPQHSESQLNYVPEAEATAAVLPNQLGQRTSRQRRCFSHVSSPAGSFLADTLPLGQREVRS